MDKSDAPVHPHLLGPRWAELRFNQLGWRLLPLRGFLGVTFLYASLQKLANPDYLRAGSPTSFVAQTRALESSSPIAPLLRLSLHAPTLVALLIAFGELAVALGVIAGIWTRAAAIGGMLLSLTFFLTVSWSATPYFYGSDIVFVFAWSVFATCGSGGVLSVDAWIGARVDADGYHPDGPVDLVRRQIVVGARSAAALAVFGGLLGGATALIGRAVGGTRRDARLQTLAPDPSGSSISKRHAGSGANSGSSASTPPDPSRPAQHHPATTQPSGTALGPASDVPVGQGRQFTDPASGQPAWLLRPAAAVVNAFSAVCTHAGCTVGFDASTNEFRCPCHGGSFDAKTGAVLGGPPPSPLRRIPARIVNNEIRVD